MNLTVHYKVQASSPNSSIPYEDITCIYQLDDNDWKNATLCCVSQQTFWYDPTFKGYWVEIDCNYTATLPELAAGSHSLNISLTPNLNYYYRTLSNGNSIIVRNGAFYDSLPHEPINFTVVNDDNITPSINESVQLSTIVLLALGVSGLITLASLVLIKFKRLIY